MGTSIFFYKLHGYPYCNLLHLLNIPVLKKKTVVVAFYIFSSVWDASIVQKSVIFASEQECISTPLPTMRMSLQSHSSSYCSAMQILQICLFPVATIFFDSVLLHPSKKSSRYPDPKNFAARPTIPQLPIVRLQERAVEEMRNYALTYGAAVRQRINRYRTIQALFIRGSFRYLQIELTCPQRNPLN